ncbi:MAG: hypothetical protein HXX08_25435, partial [Chloroflexi bacterium]|nr:hypothetical protein [Chloroflexota bacterium]
MKCRQFYFTLRRSGLAMLMLLSLAFSAAAMPQQAAKAGFDSYNYGNLKPGSSSQATFTFTVAASISTSVTTLDQFGYAFSIVSDGCTGFSGDGSCNVVVSFTPPFSGYFSAILQFSYLNETEQNAQIYLFGKGSIGASLVCAASVSPDRSLKVATETVVGATFKVKNQGISGSFDQYLEMPFDATLIPAYTSFSDPGMWVSSSEGGKLKIALPSLGAGATFSGTVFFRLNPENMPVAGKELSFNYYVLYSTNALPARDIAWDSSSILLFREESTVTGTCYSNTVKVSFTDGNRDETVGKVM